VKDANHSRIPPCQHARNASRPSSIPPRKRFIDQYLIALHRAVQLVRWNKQIVVAVRAAVGPHKPVAIAMQVEPPRHQPVMRRPSTALGAPSMHSFTVHEWGSRRLLEGRYRQRPLLLLGLHQLAAHRDPRKLL